ncbi:hypothetical protein GQ44DRAFT_827488 [Phaeosphaeriaceae sp. PMI808]|nr:hypothetical protein GQ44DRAFT_827488 [Phaeosphaeriaceae sp. PMI808]
MKCQLLLWLGILFIAVVHATGNVGRTMTGWGNRLRMFKWSGKYCPAHPDRKRWQMYFRQCYDIDPHLLSVKIVRRWQHSEWFYDVGQGKLLCWLDLYSAPDCLIGFEALKVVLPDGLNKCITSNVTFPIRSVIWRCKPTPEDNTIADYANVTMPDTLWDGDDDDDDDEEEEEHTEHVTDVTLPKGSVLPKPKNQGGEVAIPLLDDKAATTATSTTKDVTVVTPPVKAVAVVTPPAKRVPILPPPVGNDSFVQYFPRRPGSQYGDLSPRMLSHHPGRGDIAYVWMMHPWALSVICFECWTKHHNNFNWVKCYSGPKVWNGCAPRPIARQGEPRTTFMTSTKTVYVKPNKPLTQPTGTPSGNSTGTPSGNSTELPSGNSTKSLSKRFRGDWKGLGPGHTWSTLINMMNPWVPGQRLCGKAHWVHRRKKYAHVKIRKLRVDHGGDCTENTDIDIPEPIFKHYYVTLTVTQPPFPTQTLSQAQNGTIQAHNGTIQANNGTRDGASIGGL